MIFSDPIPALDLGYILKWYVICLVLGLKWWSLAKWRFFSSGRAESFQSQNMKICIDQLSPNKTSDGGLNRKIKNHIRTIIFPNVDHVTSALLSELSFTLSSTFHMASYHEASTSGKWGLSYFVGKWLRQKGWGWSGVQRTPRLRFVTENEKFYLTKIQLSSRIGSNNCSPLPCLTRWTSESCLDLVSCPPS